MANQKIEKGTLIVLENTGQVGKMEDWDYSPTFAKVKIVTPSGPKIVTVLKTLIHVVEIIDGLWPLLKKLWYTIFPSKKRKKHIAFIDPNNLPV